MGKYMKKRREGVREAAAAEVTQVVGVRTRSRSATAAAAAAAAAAAVAGAMTKATPKRRKATVHEEGLGRNSGAICYLQLRSRKLFVVAAEPRAPPRTAATSSGAEAAPAAGVSRCSSTASSVDVAGEEVMSNRFFCQSAAEEGGDHSPECSVSSSESGRGRRETTPSSQLPGELSDLESDRTGRKGHVRLPPATAVTVGIPASARTRMPAVAEIEEFFAAAEAAEAKRFAAKYNFDVVRGVPLDAGRFEWVPVVSS